METFLKKSNITGFLLVLICGSLLHFTYQWSGENRLVALFSAINESTWEHLKLLFIPSFLYFLFEYKKYGSASENLLIARTLGLFCGLSFIPVSFYTYSGIIGKSFIAVDILIFIISIVLTFFVSSRLLKCSLHLTSLAALLLLFLILALFFFFTFFPPHIAMFLDPVRFTYGL